MSECPENQYESVCRHEFDRLHTKLDKLDEALRGNGKPGHEQRISNLEARHKFMGRLFWLCLGALIAAVAGWMFR